MDGKEKIFPVSFRELAGLLSNIVCSVSFLIMNYCYLAAVPGVTPAIFYHSLIAETGRDIQRYREFIVFHGDRVLPMFLIAYQRYNGSERLKTW